MRKLFSNKWFGKDHHKWAPFALGVIVAGVFIYGYSATNTPARDGEVIWARTVIESEGDDMAGFPQDGSVGPAANDNVYVKYAYVAGKIDARPSENVVKAVENTDIQIVKEDISLRTKNSRTFLTSSSSVKVSEFISGAPQYYKDDKGNWWQADYATTTPEEFSKLPKTPLYARLNDTSKFAFVKRAFATTSTFYPDPNVEVTTVDGNVDQTNANAANATWTTLRNSVGNGSNDNPAGTARIVRLFADNDTTDSWQAIMRSIYGFDTSSIPDTDTISSATFSVYGGGTKDDNFSQSVVVDRSVPQTATNLINSDFDITRWDGVEQASGRITITAWSTTAYNDFTLNATGLGNVSKTGVSWFGLRISADFDNSPPTWSAAVNAEVRGEQAETTGTTSDPKLVVVHSAPPPSSGSIFNTDIIFGSDMIFR